MNKIQNLLENMCIQNFSLQKKTQKNKIIKLTKQFLSVISGKNIQLLLKSIENDTKIENEWKTLENLSKYNNLGVLTRV